MFSLQNESGGFGAKKFMCDRVKIEVTKLIRYVLEKTRKFLKIEEVGS